MFKKYLIILISSIIYANPTPSPIKIVSLNEPFTIKSSKSIFNTDILYTYKELLKCNPKLNAVYKIEGIHKVKIIPKKQLQSGTLYQCKYGKDTIKFRTKPFGLRDYNFFKRDKLIKVEFNDNISPKDVKKYIKLTKIDKLSTTDLTYSIIQQSSNTLLLKINEPVYNNPIELTIDKELKNINGKSLGEEFSNIFNAKKSLTVTLDNKKESMDINDKPRMVSLDSGEFAIRLFFDDTLDNSIKDFIEIDGIDNFRISRDNYVGYRQRKRLKLSSGAYYYTDIISPEFKPNHTYKITIKKGLRTYRELKEDKHYTLKSGDLAKTIIFEDKKPYVSNNGELGFSTINLNSATLIVQRVLDDNMRYFVNFENANKSVVDRYLEEVFTKEIKLNNIKNKLVKQKFKFSSLDEDLPFGVYKITLRYSDGEEEKKSSRVLFLSNIGISANISKTQAFIHIMKLDSAKPLVTAMVYLYGENNQLIGSAKSDKYGMVVIEDSELLSKKPIGIVVETKSDRNFLVLDRTISSPSPDEILNKEERFRANIYLQSNIVRPASKINALITIKDRAFISAKKLPIKIVFKQRYGKIVQEKIYHTDNYGLIDFNYQLDNEDKTGTYEIVAYIDKTIIGSTTLKVEAFMPPKIENHIKMARDNYLSGELIEANISSSYLFGTPASYLNGKISLSSRPIEFSLYKYKGYSFSNPNRGGTMGYLAYNEDIRLDSNGKINIALPTIIKNRVPSILEVTLGVTIMDDNQPVSKYRKLKLFPYKNMVGLKVDTTHLEKGQELKGRAILINPLSGEEINRKLYAVIKKIDWHYSYTNGNSNWEKESRVVDSFTIKPNEPFARKVGQNGDYIIEVYDHLGGHSASSDFEVWWQDYSNISPKDDLKSVEIDFEDKLYKKGDSIIATIKSPILNGELLLTIEDNKVESYRLVHIEKGVAKVDIPLTFDMKKGAYLHATVYRASDTSSKLIPFRAMGYEYIEPDNTTHKIDIKIEAPKVTKSKRVMKLNIVTSKPSKILVSVVDRGILQLTNQEEPKIFDFFNKEADKKISYYDLYDKLMAYLTEGKIIDFGAGDIAGAGKRKHLAPDFGKRVKPFMVWSGIIEPMDNNTTIGIDIPQFNGKASIIAVAVNEDSIGVSSKDIIVKDDVMIKPSYPLYALKGDKIIVPVRVFNTTKEIKNITLASISSKNIEFKLEDNNLTLSPNSSTIINPKLNPKEIGKSNIKLIAKFGKDEVVTNSVELPIYSPYAISTKTFKGISNKKENFTIPKEYIGAKAYITLSNNLIGVLGNDLKYLVSYPYGCAEQTTSKILAMYYARPFLKNTILVGESKNFIRQGIKKLRNMQNYYGEFSYWEKDGEINPYASLYASQTLLELKRDGVYIDQFVIDKTIKALKAIVLKNGDYLGDYSEFHRVYAGYILAENSELSDSSFNMLLEKGFYKEFFLSKYYMSAILKIKGKTKEAEELYASVGYKLSSYLKSRYSNYSGNFESNIRDMLLQFIIKTKYFKVDVKDLATIEKSFNTLYSTQERAIALKAVSIYLGKPTNSKLDVNLTINGKSRRYTKPISLIVNSVKDSNILLAPNSNAMSYNIELVKNLPKKIKNRLSKSKKISIKRVFINEDNRSVNLNSLKQGDKIYSQVTIANYGEFKSVVVNQRVPSCLTIVNSRIQNETPDSRFKNVNINQEYKEIRDDRVLNFIDLNKKQIYNKKSKKYITKENKGIIFTPLLVTTKGECKIPAVIIESMYDSRVNDYAKGVEKIIVLDKIKEKKADNISLEDKAKALVKKLYYREMQSNNPQDFIELFSYPLSQYYHKKNVTKRDIIKDKVKYFRDWTKRDYQNIKLKTIRLDKKEKEATIKITFDYTLKNSKKELKGVSKHLLTIKEINGKVLITKIEVAK